MVNLFLRIRYVLMKLLNIKSNTNPSQNCELLYTENFRNLRNWTPTNLETIKCSRAKGATLSFHQVDTKSFLSPCIISRAAIEGGCVRVTAILNSFEKLIQYFTLRYKSQEIGFKAVNGKIYLVAPHMKPVKFKLYHYDDEHTFDIEIDPETDMIYWRIDRITIHTLHFPSLSQKHLTIGMGAAQGKMNPKELPQSFNVTSVQFFTNDINQLTRKK